MTKLELHKVYDFYAIEKLVNEHELYNEDGYQATELSPIDLDDVILGAIGEEVWRFYLHGGTLAANFVLQAYGTTSWWRCIYVCATLSATGKDEV